MPYDAFDVPVPGGALRVGRWGSNEADAPVAIAAHGITGNHLSWQAVARALGDDVSLVAPDLRGRARSAGLPGPFGMAAHADDVRAVLDHFGVDRAVVVGHSMGGFVAAVTAERHSDRARAVVLVDGGLPLPVPGGLDVRSLDPDRVVAAVIGPARARLDMTFASGDDYRAFWRAHPAFAGAWSDEVEAFVDYDLTGEPPLCRSSVSLDAVLADTEDMFVRPDAREAVGRLPCPAFVLRAARGMLNEVPPLYTDEAVAARLKEWPQIRNDVVVDDTNHYTIVLSPHGAKAVAEEIRAAVAADRA